MINNHKPHHIYLHKRIPEIIIEPQKQQTKKKRITQNPKDNDVNDNIIHTIILISDIITKNKPKNKK